ncbi:MAG: hypothetical protein EPN33_10315 [Acidobacteria bacterium]|nr:MAG: hypothetical protein EPN33_10315 [Acidobacteriota bacterium]
MPAKAAFPSLAYRLDLRKLESLPFTPPPLRGHEKGWQPVGGWPATLGEAFDCLRRFSGLDDPHAYFGTVLAAGRLDCIESDVVMPNGTLPVGRDTFGNALLLELVRLFKHDAYPFAATWFYFGRDRFCSEGCPDADLYQFFLAGGDTIFSSIGTIFASKGFDPSVFVPAERWSLVDPEDCGSPSVEPDDSAYTQWVYGHFYRSTFVGQQVVLSQRGPLYYYPEGYDLRWSLEAKSASLRLLDQGPLLTNLLLLAILIAVTFSLHF